MKSPHRRTQETQEVKDSAVDTPLGLDPEEGRRFGIHMVEAEVKDVEVIHAAADDGNKDDEEFEDDHSTNCFGKEVKKWTLCALLLVFVAIVVPIAFIINIPSSRKPANLEVESLNSNLSYIGKAIYSVLSENHENSRYKAWNLSSGSVVGSVQYTPANVWGNPNPIDPKANQDFWFPEKIGEIIARAEKWVDIMSLTPPDGKFLSEFKAAINKLALAGQSTPENPIIIRMLFNRYDSRRLESFSIDFDAFIKELTEDLNSTDDINIRIWVGAWFIAEGIDLGWNHAKLIAVDGIFLHTGGHNMWHKYYLSENPAHDLSVEFEGSVAVDGHHFANQQWNFLEKNYKGCNDAFCVMSISEFPKGVEPTFPPKFVEHEVEATANYSRMKSNTTVPN